MLIEKHPLCDLSCSWSWYNTKCVLCNYTLWMCRTEHCGLRYTWYILHVFRAQANEHLKIIVQNVIHMIMMYRQPTSNKKYTEDEIIL